MKSLEVNIDTLSPQKIAAMIRTAHKAGKVVFLIDEDWRAAISRARLYKGHKLQVKSAITGSWCTLYNGQTLVTE